MPTPTPIPLLDLAAQNAPLMPELRAAFERVMAHGRFIMGPEVDAFEAELSEYLGVHAIGVASGTDALLLSLMALDVGPGDEVITTAFSFFATAGCILRLGARPVFVDIDPSDCQIAPGAVAAAISPATRAVIPVHLFGQACDLDGVMAACAERGIPVVEDAAQSLGARCGERVVGTVGATGCFSFFPSKTLGGFGDGGLVSTGDAALAARLRLLRAHGAKPKYHHPEVGGNFRLDALQAALLRVKLPHLDSWARGRRRNAARYEAHFASAGLPTTRLSPPVETRAGHVYNQYVVRTPERDALRAHLRKLGIGSEIYYPEPLHRQPCLGDAVMPEGSLPEAERACREVLALPIYAELPPEHLDRVASAVTEFLASGN